jgi:hypothetical protein
MSSGGRRGPMHAAGKAAREPLRRRWWRTPGRAARSGPTALRDWWQTLSVWWRVVAGVAGAGLAVAVAGLLAWPSSSSSAAPQAGESQSSFTACLLTGSRGLAAADTALLWRGMQDASLATEATVEYLPVMSGTTVAAAIPYLASLVERHCNVVVAAGAAEVAAVSAQARRFPSVQFVVPGPAAAGSHVTGLRVPASALPDAVASVITSAVRHST